MSAGPAGGSRLPAAARRAPATATGGAAPPPLKPLEPEDPGVETNVPAATVEKESMLDATSEKPPDPPPPYQVGTATAWPAAVAAAATSSKTRAQRSARPNTMAYGRKRLKTSCASSHRIWFASAVAM